MSVFTTFKDFFQDKLFSDKIYRKFSFTEMSKARLDEMAMRGQGLDMGDKIKAPISLDKESIDFLHQFPTKFWVQAERQRWNMLHDALLALHQRRTGMGLKDLEDKIEQAMLAGWHGDSSLWDSLADRLSPETLERLRKKFTPQRISHLMTAYGLSEAAMKKEIRNEAETEAYEEIKSKTEGLEHQDANSKHFTKDEPQEFTFGSTKIKAHPYLNRLYHKIERTEGHDHDPRSGLADLGVHKGHLGYDLAHPEIARVNDKEHKRTTRGAGSWPTNSQGGKRISQAINNLFMLNQHEMFGKLNVPPGAEWREVDGAKDTFYYDQVFDQHLEDLKVKYSDTELRNRDFPEWNPRDIVEKGLKPMAKELTNKDVEEGKIPPSPTPPGLNIPPEERMVRMGPKGPIFPKVYLPHVKKVIHGEEKWVPVMNGSQIYNRLGDEEWHYKHDEHDRRVLSPTGEPEYDWDRLKDRMVGPTGPNGRQYHVRVNPEEYHKSGGKGHQAGTAYQINQNATGRKFLSRLDDAFYDAYQKAFGSQETSVGEKGTIYNDFNRGIWGCITQPNCGDARRTERSFMRQHVEDIHQVVVMKALQTLRGSASRPKVAGGEVVEEEEELHTPEGRMRFAAHETSKLAQANFGAGTRSKRKTSLAKMDISRHTVGSGGGEIGDNVDDEGGGRRASDYGDSARGRGTRFFDPTSGENWLNDVGMTATEKQRMLNRLAALAKAADDAVPSQIQSAEDIHNMQASWANSVNVIDDIKQGLTQVYLKNNPSLASDAEGLQKDIDDLVDSWISSGAKNTQALVAKFRAHPLVAAITGETPEAEPEKVRRPPSQKAMEAIEAFKRSSLHSAIIESKGKANWPQIAAGLKAENGKYSTLVKNFAARELDISDEETPYDEQELEILEAIQDYINDNFLKTATAAPATTPVARPRPIAPTQAQAAPALAAREIEARPTGATRNPAGDNEPFHALVADKRHLDVVHHPHFATHIKSSPNKLAQYKAKMDDWLQRGYISQQDHAAAMAKITAAGG